MKITFITTLLILLQKKDSITYGYYIARYHPGVKKKTFLNDKNPPRKYFTVVMKKNKILVKTF